MGRRPPWGPGWALGEGPALPAPPGTPSPPPGLPDRSSLFPGPGVASDSQGGVVGRRGLSRDTAWPFLCISRWGSRSPRRGPCPLPAWPWRPHRRSPPISPLPRQQLRSDVGHTSQAAELGQQECVQRRPDLGPGGPRGWTRVWTLASREDTDRGTLSFPAWTHPPEAQAIPARLQQGGLRSPGAARPPPERWTGTPASGGAARQDPGALPHTCALPGRQGPSLQVVPSRSVTWISQRPLPWKPPEHTPAQSMKQGCARKTARERVHTHAGVRAGMCTRVWARRRVSTPVCVCE